MTSILSHPMYVNLLACIRERPDDDGPRLVMADFMEEEGEADRAEFVRKQIEYANCPKSLADDYPYARELEDETMILLTRHGDAWTREVVPDTYQTYWPNMDRDMTGCSLKQPDGSILTAGFWWRRGFVSKVRLPWPEWRDRGDGILAAQPVTDVEIVGPVEVDWSHVVIEDHARMFWLRDAKKPPEFIPFTRAAPEAAEHRIRGVLLQAAWPSVKNWHFGSGERSPENSENLG